VREYFLLVLVFLGADNLRMITSNFKFSHVSNMPLLQSQFLTNFLFPLFYSVLIVDESNLRALKHYQQEYSIYATRLELVSYIL